MRVLSPEFKDATFLARSGRQHSMLYKPKPTGPHTTIESQQMGRGPLPERCLLLQPPLATSCLAAEPEKKPANCYL